MFPVVESRHCQGGVADTIISVHIDDILHSVFGLVIANQVRHRSPTKAARCLQQGHARGVGSSLGNAMTKSADTRTGEQRACQFIRMGDEPIVFSVVFTDIHTRVGQDMLAAGGVELRVHRVDLDHVGEFQEAAPLRLPGDCQPILRVIMRT